MAGLSVVLQYEGPFPGVDEATMFWAKDPIGFPMSRQLVGNSQLVRYVSITKSRNDLESAVPNPIH